MGYLQMFSVLSFSWLFLAMDFKQTEDSFCAVYFVSIIPHKMLGVGTQELLYGKLFNKIL